MIYTNADAKRDADQLVALFKQAGELIERLRAGSYETNLYGIKYGSEGEDFMGRDLNGEFVVTVRRTTTIAETPRGE